MSDFTPKKVFVLGSTSFGGAYTVDGFLSEGCEVIGVSRSKEPHEIFLPFRKNTNFKNYTYHRLDVNNDNDRIIELIQHEKPDTILDFAGQGMVAPSWNWPEQWYNTNIVAKVKIHNSLKNSKFLKRYVRVSTPEVYGHTENAITEDHHLNPSTPYAVSHAAIDMSLAAYHRQYDFPMVLTRFANFYGSGQQLYRIVPRTMISALLSETLPLHGGGHSIRAFIHGRDVAEGIIRSVTLGQTGEAYHFSTDEFISIRDLVEKIANSLDVPSERFVQISEDRPGKDKAYILSTKKSEKNLSWKPKWSLDQGIDDCSKWVKDNIDIIKDMPRDYVHKR